MKGIYSGLIKGTVGLFAFPVFSVLTAGLFASALLSFAAGLLRTFGMDLKMSAGIAEVPQLLSLPFGLIFSMLFLYLAVMSWKALRFFYRFVAGGPHPAKRR